MSYNYYDRIVARLEYALEINEMATNVLHKKIFPTDVPYIHTDVEYWEFWEAYHELYVARTAIRDAIDLAKRGRKNETRGIRGFINRILK